MTVPTIYELMFPVLRRHAEASEPLSVGDYYSALAEELGLSHEDLMEQIPSGGGRKLFQSRLQGARHYLTRAGSLESPSRGTSVITPSGRIEVESATGSMKTFVPVSKRYPVALDVPGHGQTLQVRSQQSHTRRLDRYTSSFGFQTRRAVVLVDGQEAGTFELVHIQIQGWGREDLLDELAECSEEVPQPLKVIFEHWRDPRGCPYGAIIEVRLARMTTAFSKQGLFAASVNALLDRKYRNRSLLILKAWPLELEHRADDAAFKYRQRALIRHCSRSLGVVSFPGARGEEGWMYAIPECKVGHVDPPSDQSLRTATDGGPPWKPSVAYRFDASTGQWEVWSMNVEGIWSTLEGQEVANGGEKAFRNYIGRRNFAVLGGPAKPEQIRGWVITGFPVVFGPKIIGSAADEDAAESVMLNYFYETFDVKFERKYGEDAGSDEIFKIYQLYVERCEPKFTFTKTLATKDRDWAKLTASIGAFVAEPGWGTAFRSLRERSRQELSV